MNKNGIKNIPTKKDILGTYKKLNPEMSILIDILKYILHPKMFEMLYPYGEKNLSIFNKEYTLSIKYDDDHYVIFSSKMEDIICQTLNEAVCEYCKKIIHVRGDCNGFNFNVLNIDLDELVPRIREKWYYNTGCLIPLNDYLFDCVNHISINNWKYYLDLTKVNSIKLIEFLLMRKIVERRNTHAIKNC